VNLVSEIPGFEGDFWTQMKGMRIFELVKAQISMNLQLVAKLKKPDLRARDMEPL